MAELGERFVRLDGHVDEGSLGGGGVDVMEPKRRRRSDRKEGHCGLVSDLANLCNVGGASRRVTAPSSRREGYERTCRKADMTGEGRMGRTARGKIHKAGSKSGEKRKWAGETRL